jgi:hypothetical protein
VFDLRVGQQVREDEDRQFFNRAQVIYRILERLGLWLERPQWQTTTGNPTY